MKTVHSKDGTTIAYDQLGEGPAVILVAGALGIRSHPMVQDLAALVAQHFSVINYDRRGRGDSSDTPPYAVKREVEDIEALIDRAGGAASLFGRSSGAVLALEAASRLPDKVRKLALYEPPFIFDDSRPPVPEDYVAQLTRAAAEGRPGDAVEIFLTRAILIPPEFVAQMRNAPMGEVFDTEISSSMPSIRSWKARRTTFPLRPSLPSWWSFSTPPDPRHREKAGVGVPDGGKRLF